MSSSLTRRNAGSNGREHISRRDANQSRAEQSIRNLVGASVLDVAGLLAAVADTLGGGLGRAVTRQVADLTAW